MNLSHAILYADIKAVEKELITSENINYVDEYGYTPLIQTAIVNSTEKAKLLLKKGADTNQKDVTGRTALHWAVSNCNTELCKLLLEHDANPNLYTIASEPILTKAILRGENELKRLLAEHGASYQFANDYINAKLLGHRYELIGSVDIVDPEGVFTEVDYEGFYMDSSIDLIYYSLQEFQKNYAARAISSWFNDIETITKTLNRCQNFLQHDHYLADKDKQRNAAQKLIDHKNFIIPISQEGHAFSVIKYGNLIAIIDRAKISPPADIIPIYFMNRPSNLNAQLIQHIAYEKQPIKYIHSILKKQLGLQSIEELPISDQTIGNCSWANIEAIIPTLKFMMNLNSKGTESNKDELLADSFELFHRWRDFDSERALHFITQEFKKASTARKASMAALLAAIVFQRCSADDERHYELAKELLPMIMHKGFEYIIESYKQFYVYSKPTKAGENFIRIIERYKKEVL